MGGVAFTKPPPTSARETHGTTVPPYCESSHTRQPGNAAALRKRLTTERRMLIYVLDINSKPLMPTRRAGKVRRMLADGRAENG